MSQAISNITPTEGRRREPEIQKSWDVSSLELALLLFMTGACSRALLYEALEMRDERRFTIYSFLHALEHSAELS
jgi:hypothetical protein